jgi:hypothetical protein
MRKRSVRKCATGEVAALVRARGASPRYPSLACKGTQRLRNCHRSRGGSFLEALRLLAKQRLRLGIAGMTLVVGLVICVRAVQTHVPPSTLALTLLSLLAFSFLIVVLQLVERKLKPPASR